MRPKIVILTLCVAFFVLGLAAVLKGVARKRSESGETTQTLQTNSLSGSSTNTLLTGFNGNIANTVEAERIRAIIIAKAIEEIQDIQAQADGTNNPLVIASLISKMSNPELEVRKAALEAVKQLNDTNAISKLQQVADATKDPHEKVAVLDVIDYLNLPSATPAVPPADYANGMADNSNAVIHIKNPKRHVLQRTPASETTPAAAAPTQ